jgi:hypothetical protein
MSRICSAYGTHHACHFLGRPHPAEWKPANPERLRELIRAAVVRDTRAVVALKLPRRHAVTIRVDGSESERAAYHELATAARRLAAEGSSRDRLVLHHLLGAAGSSPTAATAAVKRLAGRRADEPDWHALAQRWAAARGFRF